MLIPSARLNGRTTPCRPAVDPGDANPHDRPGRGAASAAGAAELGQDGFTRLVRHAYDSGVDPQKKLELAGRARPRRVRSRLPARRRVPGNDWLQVAMVVSRVTVGYQAPAGIDDAIENLDLALA